jgi:hypothetical protein
LYSFLFSVLRHSSHSCSSEPFTRSSSAVSICTAVPVKQVN